jgi:septal ring factor EnvC (AmiA/AmiB activator)
MTNDLTKMDTLTGDLLPPHHGFSPTTRRGAQTLTVIVQEAAKRAGIVNAVHRDQQATKVQLERVRAEHTEFMATMEARINAAATSADKSRLLAGLYKWKYAAIRMAMEDKDTDIAALDGEIARIDKLIAKAK